MFPPVDEIRPGQTLAFTIEVEAIQAGDARFRAEVKARTCTKPLQEEQAARVTAKWTWPVAFRSYPPRGIRQPTVLEPIQD